MFWPDQPDEARLREPAQDAVPPAGVAVRGRASSRRAAPCASWPRPTWPTSSRRFATAASPTRCRCARGELLAGFDDDAKRGVDELARLRARPAAGGLARRGAGPSRPATSTPARASSCRRGCSSPTRSTKPRCAPTWRGSRAPGKAPARARPIRRSSAGSADELGLAPGAELKSLHDSLGAAAVAAAPSAAAVSGAPDDGFVGRSVELRRIAELLAQDDCRLLSLVGPGGVGKTRLAQRALRELAARFADGAVFVPLEDVATPGELGSRLAREIGIGVTRRRRSARRRSSRSCASAGCCSCSTTSSTWPPRRRAARAAAAVPVRALGSSSRRACGLAIAGRMAAAARRPAVPGAGGRGSRRGVRRRAPVRRRRRNASSRRWRPPPRPRRSSTSAARSKACRWRSSSRPRGRACCPARRSPPSCSAAPSCCTPPTPRTRRGTRASRWCSSSRGGC